LYSGLCLVLYLLLATIVYSFGESISFVNGFYISVITFTTVGYGDLSPSSRFTKVFTCFYVLIGLFAVVQLIDYIIDYIVTHRQARRNTFLRELYSIRKKMSVLVPDHMCLKWMPFTIPNEYLKILSALGQSLVIIGLYVLLGTLWLTVVSDHYSITDAVYLACMTITTVGYGTSQ
jgi:potassium channel subfamily K